MHSAAETGFPMADHLPRLRMANFAIQGRSARVPRYGSGPTDLQWQHRETLPWMSMDSMAQVKIHKGDFDLSVGVDVRFDGEDVTFHVKPGQLGGLCCSRGPCACHELRRPFLQGGRLFAPEDLGRSVPDRGARIPGHLRDRGCRRLRCLISTGPLKHLTFAPL